MEYSKWSQRRPSDHLLPWLWYSGAVCPGGGCDGLHRDGVGGDGPSHQHQLPLSPASARLGALYEGVLCLSLNDTYNTIYTFMVYTFTCLSECQEA